jgi:hypothetical protein
MWVVVLVGGFALAVACAAVFSGGIAAPLTAMPIAAVTGATAGWLYCRDL